MQCPETPLRPAILRLALTSLAIMTLAISLASAATEAAKSGNKREPVDGIVAQVDDQIILLSEIEEMRQVLAMQNPAFRRTPAALQRREMLERIIEEKVVLAKAKQDTTIRVSEKDLTPRVEETYQQYVKQSGGEKALETALKQTTGMNPVQFKARLLDQMRDQAYRQRLQMKYVGDHDPSNSQVQEFYTRYKDSLPTQRDGIKLAHIQLRIQAGRVLDSAAFAKANEVIARLDKGERFDSLAKQTSEDPSGKDGGDIGYTRRGTLDPDYERAAFSLDAGDYTLRPVRSRFGWHVIKVTGKKDNEARTSHIFIRVTPSAEDTAQGKVRADSLRTVLLADTNKARAAKTFADIARKLSDDRKTKALGGSLGWFQKDQIDDTYKSAVDTLKQGDISAPILIGDSWNLFLLENRAEERHLTLDEDWTQIAQVAKNWQANQKLNSFVQKWRESILVEDRLATFTGLPENSGPSGIENTGTESGELPVYGPASPGAE